MQNAPKVTLCAGFSVARSSSLPMKKRPPGTKTIPAGHEYCGEIAGAALASRLAAANAGPGLTVTAIAISLGRSWQVGVTLVLSSVVFIGLVRAVGYFEYIHVRRRQKERLRSRDSEILRRLLPHLPARFEAARSEADILSALAELGREAHLSFVEIIPSIGGEPTAFRWTNPTDADPFGRDVVSAGYPIGRDDAARAELKFGFRSDFGDVSPQTEVLLQVVTDMVEANLSRVKSRLAPRPAAEASAALPRAEVVEVASRS